MEVKLIEAVRKYSFWQGVSRELGVARARYLSMLAKYQPTRSMVAISGARRVGKSFLLRQYIHQLHSERIPPANILYLRFYLRALDLFTNESTFDELLKWWRAEILSPESPSFIMIDEVQELANWNSIVADLVEDYINIHKVIISGSNSALLGKELTTKLSGRYHLLVVHPFDYAEFCAGTNNDMSSRHSFYEYYRRGCLPETCLTEDDDARNNLLETVQFSTVQKDIIERYNPSNPLILSRLISFLIANNSSSLSIHNIVNALNSESRKEDQVGFSTIESYLHMLSQVYFVHSPPVYSYRAKDLLKRTAQKHYLNDWAYSLPAVHTNMSKVLENMIFMELLKNKYEVKTYLAYRGKNLEVDFVAQKGSAILFIQAVWLLGASSENPELYRREFGNLEAVKEKGRKLVVCTDEVLPASDDEIEVLGPIEFFGRLAD